MRGSLLLNRFVKKIIKDGSGNTVKAKAVILAMGSAYREIGLENEKRVGNVPYVPQKGLEGQTPYSMPNHASLKYTYE